MNRSVTIILPWIDSRLHAHTSGASHWSKSKATAQARYDAGLACRAATRLQFKRAWIDYRFFVPDLRRRDTFNMMHACKANLDGIVDAGLIPDDNWQVLSINGIYVALDRDHPRVELIFTERVEA